MHAFISVVGVVVLGAETSVTQKTQPKESLSPQGQDTITCYSFWKGCPNIPQDHEISKNSDSGRLLNLCRVYALPSRSLLVVVLVPIYS